MYPVRAISAVAPFECPPCAYYSVDHCVWCPDGADEIPGCEGCQGRERARVPWYRSPEFLVPVAGAIAATLVSAYLLTKLRLKG